MARYDIIIRGGTLADGTGAPLRQADVAVKDGLIVAVGEVAGEGAEEIDAGGKLVTPGFVDIHTHYDGQAIWSSRLESTSWHGVTTVVMGNCGVGFAPVREADRENVVKLMEGVEEIPDIVMHRGLSWSWETLPEYMAALDDVPHDVDIGVQLPHAPLRVYVMGDRALRHEPSTAEDNARMRALAFEAAKAGALGFSTSRNQAHAALDGSLTPTLRAEADELIAIAHGFADAGHGVVQTTTHWGEPRSEFDHFAKVAREGGLMLSINLIQLHGEPDEWKDVLAWLEEAAAEGVPIRAQTPPRPMGMMLGLQSTFTPFSLHPTGAALDSLPLDQKLAAYRDPEIRAKLLSEKPRDDFRLSNHLRNYPYIFAFGDPPEYELPKESSLAARAAAMGISPDELALDLLVENEGRNFMLSAFTHYAGHNLDAARTMLASPMTLPGMSDGGAHMGSIIDASYPTTMLTHWGRDRSSGRFPVEWLVRRQSADTAHAMGLFDRGIVAPGYRADLNIIDFDRLAVLPPSVAHDLPAGGRRLLQKARGYEVTMLKGRITYREGEPTGELPGRVIRGPQPEPRASIAALH